MIYSTQTLAAMTRFGIFRAVEIIADAGFPAIDLTLYGSWEQIKSILTGDIQSSAERLCLAAKRRNVIFNQAHAPFFGNRDGSYPDMIKELLPKCMALCAELKVPHIVVHPSHPYYFGRKREILDENLKLYRTLAPIARHYGVKIALENMWRTHKKEGRIIDSVYSNPRELADAYDALDNPECFTVCLDIGHVALTGREPTDAIRTIGHDRLGALHVHDVDYISDLHTLPGAVRGINFDKVCEALGEINYRGDLTLEADGFLDGFDNLLFSDALKFMNSVAKKLAERVDFYRKA